MGYFANVYRINFDTLAGIKGAKNSALLRELRDSYPDDDEEYEDDEERPPMLSEAFAAIINGSAVDDPSWPTYSDACHCIYARFGAQLESNVFCPSQPPFVVAVLDAIDKAGLGERVPIFVPREPPLWPEPSQDFPILSHMTPSEVAAARGAIEAHDWKGLEQPIRDALTTIGRWIDEAAARGEGLVCAYG